MRQCEACCAIFGPGERNRRCVRCGRRRVYSVSDRAIAVLEQAETALPYWDVRRLIERDYGATTAASLLGALRWDARACWAGKARYGLYRHGLLPGARDLGTVAAIYLYASSATLHYRDLWFAMQHVGYSANAESVYYALRRAQYEGLVERTRFGDWRRPTGSSSRASFTV